MAPAAVDAVLLGAPKWTVSYPPLNAFLASHDLAGVVVAPFITYAGFDAARCLRRLAARLRATGAIVPATMRVQRDGVRSPDAAAGIERFLEAVGKLS